MSEQKRNSWGRTALHVGGGGLSLLGGGWVAHFLAIPHGLPESAFTFGIAPIAALVGFELGSALGVWNRLLAGPGALVTAIVAYFLYYWMLSTSSGGAIASLTLMFLFGLTFLTLFGALGIFGIQIFDERKDRYS
jgi:hypothetical protein